MFGSSILEVAIGMVFIYLLMSLICSSVNEIMEAWFKNRATDLEQGIRELFNQKGGRGLVEQFYRHPLISGLYNGVYGRAGDAPITRKDYWTRTNLPSYIPARNFSQAVIDLLLHPAAGAEVGRDDRAGGSPDAAPPVVTSAALPVTVEAVRAAVRRNWGHTQVGRALRTLAEQSGEDVNALRQNVEAWFDGAMDRVSGHYKRRTKWSIFFLGFAITIFLNVNSVTIARRLSTDATLRTMLVAQAEKATGQPDLLEADLEESRKRLEGLGLPIGWPGGIDWIWPLGPEFDPWDHAILPLLGWLMTAAAISLGAPFWFDLLNKFMVIRATVKPREKSREEGSEDRQQEGQTTNLTLAALGTALGPRAAGQPDPAAAPAPVAGPEPPATPEPQVAAGPDEPDNESHIDGCDVDFTEEDATPDEELPPSKGGVA